MLVPFSSHFCPDPKTLSPGSPDRHSPSAGPETQDVPHHQLRLLPYVVFQAPIVTHSSVAENSDMIISPPWYTSGKSRFDRNSDLPETTIL